ncbi:MAG: hypothetical protein HRF51_13055 [bacterium]|jgi:CRP-like cAMP-binding protein
MEKELLESIDKSLRVILVLLLRQRESDILTLREQIGILFDLGLKPKEISEVLGRSGVYVNKEISELRKSQKGRNKK